ncbi:deoxyribonuclease IV [bacterium]|nr:deoxyribonuclease IV [bacterium]
MRFGAHVSISGGVFNAPQNGKNATCDVVQIFTKNQVQWRVPDLTDEEISRFKSEQERTGVEVVCVHASYLINLGGFDRKKLYLSRSNFVVEMQRAEALRIPYLIVHPGSHVGEGEQAGLDRISESLNYVLDKCPDFKLKILLESTAGQGDNLGYTFEQLAKMRSKVEAEEHVGVCIDTCHVFAAGYELRTKAGYERTMAELDEIVGLEQVGVFHVNDSKKELGSRVDRHDHIGDGEIGLRAFEHLVNDLRFQDVSMIIETPGGAEKHAENLKTLRGLVKN